jgi:tripeptidyl-peptidase-1
VPQSLKSILLVQKLGARGITITASSGDGGSHFSFGAFDGSGIGRQLNSIACQLNFPVFPAESAFVTAVGGTDWTDPAAPYAWSASGGGFSWRFPVPDYQAAVVSNYLRSNAGQSGFPPSGAFNATNRAYPDIAALANKYVATIKCLRFSCIDP